MNDNPQFWPLDDDADVEIYDTLAWDLPGFRGARTHPRPARRRARGAGDPAGSR